MFVHNPVLVSYGRILYGIVFNTPIRGQGVEQHPPLAPLAMDDTVRRECARRTRACVIMLGGRPRALQKAQMKREKTKLPCECPVSHVPQPFNHGGYLSTWAAVDGYAAST